MHGSCGGLAVGERVAGKLSLRVQQLDVRVDTKTKDNVFVRIVVSVQYQVRGICCWRMWGHTATSHVCWLGECLCGYTAAQVVLCMGKLLRACTFLRVCAF